LSNKIFKNNQVNVGIPFQVRFPVTYQPPVARAALNPDAEEDGLQQEQSIDYKAVGEAIINKARAEADMIVKEALLEAKDIVIKASDEMKELKTKVIEESKAEGYKEGVAQAENEYENQLTEVQELKEQVSVEYEKILESLEEDTVNTILHIARKVISNELKCKDNILLLVKDAFEKCSKEHKVVLKLSEQDYEYINENREELNKMLERSEEVEIKKDLSLKEGGCVIDTPLGSIDASAYSKFDKIEDEFKGILDEKMN
jgi:flagellar assembly protein FliH